MIDPHDFSPKQFELLAEFGKYVIDRAEVDERLPDGAYIFFEITDEPDFSRYSRLLAEQQRDKEGVPIVCVRTAGLAPPQRSRLIDPVIDLAERVVA